MKRFEYRIRALPVWNGAISIEPLDSSIRNESFLVADANGQHVVRFGKDYPLHSIFRNRELTVAKAAATAGFGPRIEFAEQGVIVSTYLNAKAYGPEDVRANRTDIVKLVRDFHTVMPRHIDGTGFMFWVFAVNRDCADALKKGNSRHARRMPALLALNEALEAEQGPLPIVFGHNELLPANILDDGKRLWLNDFEYAGFNSALFDLGGLSSNAGMTRSESDELLASYFDYAPDEGMRRAHALMECASLLREVLLNMALEAPQTGLGIGTAADTEENLSRLKRTLDLYQATYGKLVL